MGEGGREGGREEKEQGMRAREKRGREGRREEKEGGERRRREGGREGERVKGGISFLSSNFSFPFIPLPPSLLVFSPFLPIFSPFSLPPSLLPLSLFSTLLRSGRGKGEGVDEDIRRKETLYVQEMEGARETRKCCV